MKIQKRMLALMSLVMVVITYCSPMVFAEGDGDDPSLSGLGDVLMTQPQGPANNTSSKGDPSENQTEGNNQNDSGQQIGNLTSSMGDLAFL